MEQKRLYVCKEGLYTTKGSRMKRDQTETSKEILQTLCFAHQVLLYPFKSIILQREGE